MSWGRDESRPHVAQEQSRPVHPPLARGLITLAAAMGLAEGYLELLALAIRRFSHPFLLLGRDTLWLAPVGNLLLFVAVALLTNALFTRRMKPERFRPIVGALITCGCFALLTIPGGLRRYAALLLALGLGIRLSSVLVRHQASALRAGRVGLLILAGLTVSIGLGLHGVLRWREWRTETHLPPPPASAPNVLLIVLDAVRAQSLGLYGAPRPTTPAIEAWARGGVVFDRAVATTSWTLPSHASLFTGRGADELNANWETPLDTRFPTLAEVLESRGYRTAGFVGNVVLCSYESGLTRGFQRYEDYPVSWGTLVNSTALGRALLDDPRFRRLLGWYETPWRKPAPGLTASLLHWIDGHRDRPFFAFVNYFDAHNPYLPPRDLADRFGGGRVRQDPLMVGETTWTAEGIAAERDAYEASIAAIDRSLDSLFAGLASRGLRDNTLVILTGDHGEEFGEHGQMLHGSNLFMTTVHVPLVLLWPGRLPAGRRIAETVSLRRVAPTIEDLAGLGTRILPGLSLRPVWDSGVSASPTEPWVVSTLRRRPGFPPTWPVSLGDQIALTGDTLRVLQDGRDSLQVYDTARDPAEIRPLPPLSGPLRSEVDSLLRAVHARDVGAAGD